MKDVKKTITIDFSLKAFIYNKRTYIFAFFIPFILLVCAYAVFGVFPFGKESVLVLDLNGQYVYYFENLRDAFWGNGSLFNSWSRNFSGEIMGMFAYYLASPFTLIVMLLPRGMMAESLLIMQLCKVGTAGLTFCYYLKKSKKSSSNTALLFTVLYALMGYMIVQLMNPMWLDGLILLPLITIGIEKLIDEKRWLYFIIPLALMFIANFYIGWMIAIYCIIYFIFYSFVTTENAPFKFKGFLLSGIKFAAGGIIAAACAAWLLIPLYYSLKLGKFDFSTPDYSMTTQFGFLDFFINLLPNVYDTCRPEGSPVVYSGVLTIILVPLFFLNENIRLKQKVGYGIIALFIILSMYMSTIDLVWHGLQVPNWLPYRYSFIFSFILLVMAAQAFDRIEGISFKEIGCVFFGVAGYALYADTKGLENVTLLATVWYTVIFAFIYALLLYMHKKHYRVKPVPVVIVFIIMIEMVISSAYTMYRIDTDVVYSSHESYNRYITLGRNTVDKIKGMDDGVYRIEKNFHRTVNDAMAFGSFGVSHSSSTLNSAPIEFLRAMGFSYGGHYIRYKGATYITDALFGIKYVMESGVKNSEDVKDDNEENEDAENVSDMRPPELIAATQDIAVKSMHYDKAVLANGDSQEIMYVYENPYALPVAFMADNAVLDLFMSGDNPFENQNELLSSLLSDDYRQFFKRVQVDETIPENAKHTMYGTHSKYVPRIEGENSHIEFLLTAPTDDMMYFYMPSSYEREANLWLDTESYNPDKKHPFLDYYFENGKMTIQTLGRFEPGQEISLLTSITDKNEVFFKDQYFYYLDQDLFEEAINELKSQPLVIGYFKEDHIKGTVNAKEDGILFTTVSWEPGWTVKVDGRETEPVKIADAFIGIPCKAGEHTIEMRFFPKGLTAGIILSVIGIVTLILLGIYERRSKKVLLDRIYEI